MPRLTKDIMGKVLKTLKPGLYDKNPIDACLEKRGLGPLPPVFRHRFRKSKRPHFASLDELVWHIENTVDLVLPKEKEMIRIMNLGTNEIKEVEGCIKDLETAIKRLEIRYKLATLDRERLLYAENHGLDEEDRERRVQVINRSLRSLSHRMNLAEHDIAHAKRRADRLYSHVMIVEQMKQAGGKSMPEIRVTEFDSNHSSATSATSRCRTLVPNSADGQGPIGSGFSAGTTARNAFEHLPEDDLNETIFAPIPRSVRHHLEMNSLLQSHGS
ncbi:MAG: hypothetical protein M4579_000402 [Chaenotheca gracillima]|nr:MAG: hypothetical protein M4579_000402 [Chaenotheca gracillima]